MKDATDLDRAVNCVHCVLRASNNKCSSVTRSRSRSLQAGQSVEAAQFAIGIQRFIICVTLLALLRIQVCHTKHHFSIEESSFPSEEPSFINRTRKSVSPLDRIRCIDAGHVPPEGTRGGYEAMAWWTGIRPQGAIWRSESGIMVVILQ